MARTLGTSDGKKVRCPLRERETGVGQETNKAAASHVTREKPFQKPRPECSSDHCSRTESDFTREVDWT